MGISQSCEEFGGIGCGCGAKKFVATIVKLFNGSILYISVPFFVMCVGLLHVISIFMFQVVYCRS
jgi:hypothetical protein